MLEKFKGQIPLIKDVCAALGIQTFEKDGFEADDIIGTLASQAAEAGMDVLICSGDRDAFQLVSETTTVLYPRKGVSDLARMTPAAVEEKYGVTPLNYPDLAALVGETSDNLPGVPGVGPKTAAKWIAAYGTLAYFADLLGNDRAKQLLGETLNEEKAADRKLNDIAKSRVNVDALVAAGMEADDDEEQEMGGGRQRAMASDNRGSRSRGNSRASGRAAGSRTGGSRKSARGRSR
jgi:DNA polymerase-1